MIDNSWVVDGISIAAKQQPSRRVTENPHCRIRYCLQNSFRSLLDCHLQVAVHGSYHEVEGRQHFIGIIEAAIVQNIALDAAEDLERLTSRH